MSSEKTWVVLDSTWKKYQWNTTLTNTVCRNGLPGVRHQFTSSQSKEASHILGKSSEKSQEIRENKCMNMRISKKVHMEWEFEYSMKSKGYHCQLITCTIKKDIVCLFLLSVPIFKTCRSRRHAMLRRRYGKINEKIGKNWTVSISSWESRQVKKICWEGKKVRTRVWVFNSRW